MTEQEWKEWEPSASEELQEAIKEEIDKFLNSLPKPSMTKEKLRAHHEKLQKEHQQQIQEDDPWKFMVAWNCETGCGTTYCLYMTATYDEAVAKERFKKKFEEYYANFMEFYSRKDFFDKFSQYIPESVKELSNKPCSLEFYTKVHYSFS